VRLFVAADLTSDLRRRLAGVQDELRGVPLPVRWVRPEGIHLTLKFLGELPDSRLEEVQTVLAGAGAGLGSFRLEAGRAVSFPARGAPRLIWIEVHGDVAAAQRLASAIDAATAGIGLPGEAREFRPHLTLGRVKGTGRGEWREALARASEPISEGFEVTEYVLFESRLGSGGSIYTARGRYPLGPEDSAGGAI
jgi:RNA 2',3'-cyclic 3'-phosphodiesterase